MTTTNALTLSAEGMLDKVTQQLGLDDFGDDRLLKNYRYAIATVNKEANFTPTGLAEAEEWMERMLRNRLLMHKDLKEHPEIHDEVLAPPVFVTGFPRSGTTKLQRMLSAAPRFQTLLLWKLLNPAPFPGTRGQEPDPRIAVAETSQEIMRKKSPELWAAHPMPAQDADEDFLLHEMTFLAPTLGSRLGARRFRDELTPIRPEVYEFLRVALKYLQWQDGAPDRATRPWILKSPIHIGNIDTVLKVFPDAKIIHCHRDVEVSIASIARVSELARLVFTDKVDRMSLGQGPLQSWSREWARNIEQRRKLDPNSYCDVRFEDINTNGVAVVEKLYAFLGMKMDDAARAAVQKWESGNQRHQHGKHVYNLTDYGLSTEQVREAFDAYFTHFAGTEILVSSKRN